MMEIHTYKSQESFQILRQDIVADGWVGSGQLNSYAWMMEILTSKFQGSFLILRQDILADGWVGRGQLNS